MVFSFYLLQTFEHANTAERLLSMSESTSKTKDLTKVEKALTALEKVNDKANKKAESMIADRKKEMESIQQKIEDAAAKIEEAIIREREATKAASVDDYIKSKTDEQRAKSEKEMYTAMLEDAKGADYVTSEEYEDKSKEIVDAFKSLHDAVVERLEELYTESNHLASILDRLQLETNSVLNKWQHDIFRDADLKKTKTGAVINTDRIKLVKANTAIHWARCGLEHYGYEELTGKKAHNNKTSKLTKSLIG